MSALPSRVRFTRLFALIAVGFCACEGGDADGSGGTGGMMSRDAGPGGGGSGGSGGGSGGSGGSGGASGGSGGSGGASGGSGGSGGASGGSGGLVGGSGGSGGLVGGSGGSGGLVGGSGGAGGSGGLIGGSGGSGGSGGENCGAGLPACPDACTGQEPGQPCTEGDVCGNEIGDACACLDSTWQCAVHPPLGEGCNLVCDPEAPCSGRDLLPCPLPCVGIQPGGACDAAGTTCGNEIGDTCVCDGARWACEVHPPLGMDCNLVCRPAPENPAPECATACDCAAGLGCFNGTCQAGVAPVYCCNGECPEGNACQLADGGYQTCRPAGQCVETSECFGHPAPIRCPGTWDCDPSQARMSDAPGDDGCNYTCVFNLLPCNPGEICPFGDECVACPIGGGICSAENVCLDPDYAER